MSKKTTNSNNQDLFTEVLNQNQEYKRARLKAKVSFFWKYFSQPKNWLKLNNFWLWLSTATTGLVVVLAVLAYFNYQNPFADNPLTGSVNSYALEKFNSCQEMGQKFNEYYDLRRVSSSKMGRPGIDYPMETVMDKRQENNAPLPLIQDTDKTNQNTTDFSSTNNQVATVDEGDLVKTDGDFIYTINSFNRNLNITKFTDGKLTLKYTISFDYNDFPKKIQLSGDFKILMVLGQSGNQTTLKTYNVDNFKNKQKVSKISDWRLSGNLLESRFVDNKLVLITSSQNAYIYTKNSQESISNVEKSLPQVSEASSKFTRNDCQNIQYISPLPAISTYTNIYTLNFAGNQFPSISQNSIVSGNQITYMSENNLYLTQPNNFDTRVSSDFRNKSTIYKFNLTNSGLKYQNFGLVQGNLLNQFSMDEYEDNLRVATNLPNVGNFISILDSDMHFRAKTEYLARDERIYAVRFLQDKGYMVTFRETDPLYTFDLSEPDYPRVTGELKIPGFSNYLHPISQDYLIGVGQSSRNGSVKISLFNVSNPQSPKEVDMKEIGGSGSTTLVNTDHKAFLWDQRNNLLILPIQVNSIDYKAGSSDKFAFQGSYIYKVDSESGFKLQARISHLNYDLLNQKVISTTSIPSQTVLNDQGEVVGQKEVKMEQQNPTEYAQNKAKYYIYRQLYIGNYLITISPLMLQAHTLDNYTKFSEVELK